jgi:hypothetical protein
LILWVTSSAEAASEELTADPKIINQKKIVGSPTGASQRCLLSDKNVGKPTVSEQKILIFSQFPKLARGLRGVG